MEMGLEESIPTYAGGLGVLAGDTVRAAADIEISMVAMTLLHRKGYFQQHLDATGMQREEPVIWPVADLLQRVNAECTVEIEGRIVQLQTWKYEVKGINGFSVPVYFLDASHEKNAEQDRVLTDYLYGGDERYRLCQEIILGIGGVRMLRALGYHDIKRYHMNEGHAALLTLELAYELAHQAWNLAYEPIQQIVTQELVQLIKPKCVFTTHTPVPAGHDKFHLDLVHSVLTGYHGAFAEREKEFCPECVLDMTALALDHSHYINGVAKRHSKVTRQMFSEYIIDSITNGVHAATWTSPSMADIFDHRIPGWREDHSSLRYALNIPKNEIWQAHRSSKRAMIDQLNKLTGSHFDPDVFTLGFARRAAVYKRADLLFSDITRLEELSINVSPIQIIYAGKAHPRDQTAKELIQNLVQMGKSISGRIEFIYLENYGINIAKSLTAGVDLWLNTPQPPLEASGTSGMKAALNGVPSLSILDGWWIEGCIEGVTGWAIGKDDGALSGRSHPAEDARSLYNKLEMIILPMFYHEQDHYADIMRNAIALNGSFFNTERMLNQYIAKAYFK
ncbi:MAG: alpha-glucan family phosphorylase [Gammaproteobacteria bacterium]|nr:alpha-glucan family phosphorylase [Gammaproteobacteria bacterium]